MAKSKETSSVSPAQTAKYRTYKKSTVDANLLSIYQDIANTMKEINKAKQKGIEYEEKLNTLTELKEKRDNLQLISEEKRLKMYEKVNSSLNKRLKIEDKLKTTAATQKHIIEKINHLTEQNVDLYETRRGVYEDILELSNQQSELEQNQLKTLRKKGILHAEIIDTTNLEFETNELLLDLQDQQNKAKKDGTKYMLDILNADIKIVEKEKKRLELLKLSNKQIEKSKKYGERQAKPFSKVGDTLNKTKFGSFINNRFGVGDYFNKQGQYYGNKAGNAHLDAGGGLKGAIAGMKAMGVMGNIMKSIGPILQIVSATIGYLVNLLFKFDKAMAEIVSGMDITRSAANDLFSTYEKRSDKYGTEIKDKDGKVIDSKGVVITAERQAQYEANMREAFDGVRSGNYYNMNKNAMDLVDTGALLQERYKLTGEEIESLHATSILTGKSMSKLVVTTDRMGDKIIGSKNALKEMAKLSKTMLASFQGTTKELIKATIKAKMLGVSLESIEKAGRSSLDIESSLESEMETRVITGMNLPMDTFRFNALQGNVPANLKILEQILTLDKWKGLNVLGKESLAKTAGLSEEEISKMVTRKSQMSNIGMTESEYTKLMDLSLSELESKIKAGGKDDYVSILRGILAEKDDRDLATKFTDMLDKFGENFITPLTGVIKILHEKLDNLTTAINKISNWFSGDSRVSITQQKKLLLETGLSEKEIKKMNSSEMKEKATVIARQKLDSIHNYRNQFATPEESERRKQEKKGFLYGLGMLFGYDSTIPLSEKIKLRDLEKAKKPHFNEFDPGPKYATGKVNINGPGTTMSDSILSRISRGESVINSLGTAKNSNYLEYANDGGSISDLIVRAAINEKHAKISKKYTSNLSSMSTGIGSSTLSSTNSETNSNNDNLLQQVVVVLKDILNVASQPAVVKLGDTFVSELDSRITLRSGMKVNIDNTWGRSI